MKKRLLYLTQTFPFPAASGGTIKTLNTLLTLSQKFEIHVLSLTDKKPSPADKKFLTQRSIKLTVCYSSFIAEPIQNYLSLLTSYYLKGLPHHIFQYSDEKARRQIHKIIVQFRPEIIHVDHFNMSQYLPKVKQQVWILEHHNSESDLLWTRFKFTAKWKRKLYLFCETWLTRFWEQQWLPKFDHVFTISEDDQKTIKTRHPTLSVSTQTLVYPTTTTVPSHKKKSDLVLFVGGLNWPPNEDAVGWFIRHVWSLVLKERPQAEFHVIGHDHPYFRHQLGSPSRVVFHGHVTDITPFLKRAKVFVLPFRMGGGIRLKALTALSHGVPLVSTALGVKGLKTKHQQTVLVADAVPTFAAEVTRLLTESSLRQKIASRGLQYLRQHHSPSHNRRFLKEYYSLVKNLSHGGENTNVR